MAIDAVHDVGSEQEPEGSRHGRRWPNLGAVTAIIVGALLVLHWSGALRGVQDALLQRLPDRPSDALLRVVNVFHCCILTWDALTVMVPAFALGGAVAAFVPNTVVLRYLGAGANQARAYVVAAISGMVLSLCSCNVVPLFVSIYRRGAGIGPAFTLLYAGPAINIVAMIFTFQVIGPIIGVWRAVGVPLIGILAGIGMSLAFRREGRARREQAALQALQSPEQDTGGARVWALFVLLLLLVGYGAWGLPWTPRLIGCGILAMAIAGLIWWRFTADDLRNWATETWGLVRLVVPILLPAVLIIGAAAAFTDIKVVDRWLGASAAGGWLGEMQPVLAADVFGALMYFPILTEVAFAKALLKEFFVKPAPALAVLLTGAGLSLPGLFIVGRAVGWRKAAVYELLVIALTTGLCWLFASEVGEYICKCMMQR